VVAERNGELVGWMSAHRPPTASEQIFVWQVAVRPDARGAGLASLMLDALVARPAVRSATTLTATITETNLASWAMFEAFARKRGRELSRTPLFEREAHFAGAHETEWRAAIGLLSPQSPASEKENV
jgi:L-2,4-diaminobutyric acid acetyltransferase